MTVSSDPQVAAINAKINTLLESLPAPGLAEEGAPSVKARNRTKNIAMNANIRFLIAIIAFAAFAGTVSAQEKSSRIEPGLANRSDVLLVSDSENDDWWTAWGSRRLCSQTTLLRFQILDAHPLVIIRLHRKFFIERLYRVAKGRKSRRVRGLTAC